MFICLYAPAPYGPDQLTLVRQPFDPPDFLFELKHGGFRALAYISDGHSNWFLDEEIPRAYHLLKRTNFIPKKMRRFRPYRRPQLSGKHLIVPYTPQCSN